MEHHLLGWPPDGPRVRLDHRRFAYAGKFVTADTGVAVTTAAAGDAADGFEESDESGTTDDHSASVPEPVTTPPDREFTEPPGEVLAATAFNADRTDESVLWLRYVTVRDDQQGRGLAGPLCAFVCRRADRRGYDTVRIAVNNPFAYDAASKAGFAYIGRETGLAELVLARPATGASPPDRERYRAGLGVFRDRELSDEHTRFLDRAWERGPPEPVTDGQF